MSLVRRALTAVVGAGVAVSLAVGLAPRSAAEDALGAAQAELTQLQTEADKAERDLAQSKQDQAAAQRKYEVTTADLVDEAWITDTFIPTVATRGGAIIKARGLSSAASAANATIDHMRDWALGTSDWVSMSVPSDGSYGLTEGLISSFPCVCTAGGYEIVQGIELSDFSMERIKAYVARLESERDQVKALGLI